MADTAANVYPTSQRDDGTNAWPIANGITMYHGMLVGLEGGYANHWADGANDVFAGLCVGGDARANDGVLTGNTSDTPPPEAHVDTSGLILEHMDSVAGTPAQAKVGDLVYCGSSNIDDLTLNSSGRNHPIGILWRYRSATDVDVKLFTPQGMLAQATA